MWTEEKEQILKDNYHRIPAKEIGEMVGKTKNSVIGKARRMGLGKQMKNRWAWQKLICAKPTAVPEVETKSLLELKESDCRWIVSGCGVNAKFCGCRVTEGKSYCEEHYRKSIRKNKKRRPEKFSKFTHKYRGIN